jgi:hypothetical protein
MAKIVIIADVVVSITERDNTAAPILLDMILSSSFSIYLNMLALSFSTFYLMAKPKA